jgi:hypothetical protein
MLVGGINYTSMAADVTFDDSLLQYEGYEDMRGFIAVCGPVGSGTVRLTSVPGTDMVYGTACQPEVRIVTLKFTVSDNFNGVSAETILGVNAIKVNPPAGYLGTRTAPGKGIKITIAEEGVYVIEFANMSDVEVSYFSNGALHIVPGRFYEKAVFAILPENVPTDGKGIIFSVAKKTAEPADGHAYTFAERPYETAGDILIVPTSTISVKVNSNGQLGLWDMGQAGLYEPGWVFGYPFVFSTTTTIFPIFDNGDTFEVRFTPEGLERDEIIQQAVAGAYVVIN